MLKLLINLALPSCPSRIFAFPMGFPISIKQMERQMAHNASTTFSYQPNLATQLNRTTSKEQLDLKCTLSNDFLTLTCSVNNVFNGKFVVSIPFTPMITILSAIIRGAFWFNGEMNNENNDDTQ